MSSNLFPVSSARIASGFTTSHLVDVPNVAHVALADKSLGVHRASQHTTHHVVTPPGDDTSRPQAWEAVFPKGSINPGNKAAPLGGFGFYLHGPSQFHDHLKTDKATEVLMSYDIMFEDDWGWQKGGKLPGIYGGSGDSAYGCTGGRQTDRCKCFNLRLMWRENGTGELYAYLPQHDANKAALLAVPPKSIQHPDYGFSVGRGAWTFTSGQWITVAERVKMNTVGSADGEIEVFINGQSVIHARGLILRDAEAPDSCVQGMHLQTFFGGHADDWASPKSQKAWFTNVSGAILKPEFTHDEL